MKFFAVLFLKINFLFFCQTAQSSLLMDVDGLDLELTAAGSVTNSLGPDTFTQGWTPDVIGNVLPAPMPDGSEIELTIFDNSFSIFQEVTSSALPSLAAWTLSISDVDWPGLGVIQSANIVSSSFAAPMLVSNTAESVTLSYSGGDFLSIGDPGFMAMVNLQIAYTSVPEPGHLAFLAGLLSIGIIRRSKGSIARFKGRNREEACLLH